MGYDYAMVSLIKVKETNEIIDKCIKALDKIDPSKLSERRSIPIASIREKITPVVYKDEEYKDGCEKKTRQVKISERKVDYYLEEF